MIIGGFLRIQALDWAKFREIADSVGATFSGYGSAAGLVGCRLSKPLPHAHVVTTTTTKHCWPAQWFILSSCGDETIYKKLNSSVFPGNQAAHCVTIAAKAVAFKEALQPGLKCTTTGCGKCQSYRSVMQERGYNIVSGGTDNHLFLLDLIDKDITGKDADAALGAANITVNKNSVPNDPRSPFVTSGLRIGSPAITRRGFKEEQAKQVATWICDILDNMGDESVIKRVQDEVVALCAQFPVYK